MKLNSLKTVGALAAVSAASLTFAVAGPYSAPAPAPIDSGAVPPPPAPLGSGGGIFDSIGASIAVGYDTDYIFRGYDIGHDSVWSQLDLSIPLGDNLEFAVGAWYQNAFNGDGDDELDIYASLAYDFGTFGLEFGYTHYAYPQGIAGTGAGSNGDESNEAYISLGTTVGPVDVSLGWYYDFDLEVSYVELAGGTSIPLSAHVSLDPSVGISYIDIDDPGPGVDGSGLNHAFAKLELPIQLTGTATLTPYVAVSSALDVADDLGEDDYFWGGVSLSVSF